MSNRGRGLTRLVVAALCLVALCCVVTGCKASDALKEVIYDQTSTNIDVNNPDKYYLSDESAELTSDRIPSEETSDDATTTVERQNLLVYSSDPNTEGYVAKQSLWAIDPDFEGLEASSGVHFYRSDDPKASEQDLPDEPEEEEDPEEEVETSDGSKGNGTGSGDVASPDSDELTPEESDNGGGDNGEETVADNTGDDGNQDGGKKTPDLPTTTGNVNMDTTDPASDPLPAGSIAAYGDAALMVQIVGGPGALAAADADLLATGFANRVDGGGQNIATGWSGDGTASGSIKVKAIIDSGADTVLVYSGSELSDSEYAQLTKAGVAVQQIYTNTNTTYVKSNALTIGEMLKDSEARTATWSTEEMAEAYVDFFNALIKETCKAANGGEAKLAGTKTLESRNMAKYGYATGAGYTLVADGFDAAARYTNNIDGWKPVSNGALLATMGTSTSATSFYVQAGGLVNNAAVKGASKGRTVVWQFNVNIAACNASTWSGLGADVTFPNWSAWDASLLTTYTGSSTEAATGNFGSDAFPRVIVGSQRAQSALLENSADPDGIYHPFGEAQGKNGFSFFGTYTSGGSAVFSTIGVDSGANVFGSGIPADSVRVCPTGLFGTWVGGTSPEAFLMAAWVCDEVNTADATVGWEDKVTEFYKTFYRCSLTPSDLKAIEAGAVK